MPFCTHCGRPLQNGGACQCSAPPAPGEGHYAPPGGGLAQGGQPMAPGVPPPHGQPPPPPSGQIPAPLPSPVPIPSSPPYTSAVTAPPPYPSQPRPRPKGTLGADLVNILRGFFSASPTRPLIMAVRATSKPFFIFAGAFVLLCGLAVMVVPANYLDKLLRIIPLTVAMPPASTLLPGGYMFLMGVVFGLLHFFTYTLLIWLLHRLYRQRVGMVCVMNMVSVGLLPFTFSYLVGIPASFLFPPFSLFLMGLAAMMSFILTYVGIQREAKFRTSPLWLYLVIYAVHLLLQGVCLRLIFVPALLQNLMTTLPQTLGPLF